MHIKIYMEKTLYIIIFITVKSLQTENRSAVNNPMTPKVPCYDRQYCLICFNIKDSEIS